MRIFYFKSTTLKCALEYAEILVKEKRKRNGHVIGRKRVFNFCIHTPSPIGFFSVYIYKYSLFLLSSLIQTEKNHKSFMVRPPKRKKKNCFGFLYSPRMREKKKIVTI